MNASLRTTAWITTGGSDSGIMKAMGGALAQYHATTPCIAIAPWGAVRDRFLLEEASREYEGKGRGRERTKANARYLSGRHERLLRKKCDEMLQRRDWDSVLDDRSGEDGRRSGCVRELWESVSCDCDVERLCEEDVHKWWLQQRVTAHFLRETERVRACHAALEAERPAAGVRSCLSEN